MQFLCECMKIDCETDCDPRGRWLKSCLGHQITQGWHCRGARTKVRSSTHSSLEATPEMENVSRKVFKKSSAETDHGLKSTTDYPIFDIMLWIIVDYKYCDLSISIF